MKKNSKALWVMAVAAASTFILLMPFLTTACAKPSPATAPIPTPTPTPTTLTPTTPAPKTIVLKFGTSLASTHHLYKNVFSPFLREVEQKSGGIIKFQDYPGEALFKAKDEYDATITRITDVGGYYGVGSYPGRFPLSGLLELPLVMPDDQATCTKVAMSVFKSHIIEREWMEVKLLAVAVMPASLIGATKPVQKLEDVKGLRLRTSGDVQNLTATALGAVPVSISPPEMTLSMQRGIIDAILFPEGSFGQYKLQEIAKYRVRPGMVHATSGVLGVSWNTWSSLPQDIQKIFIEAGERATLEGYVKSYKEALTQDTQILKAAGVTDYTLPSEELARWREAVKPVVDQYIDRLEKAGKPAKAVYAEIQRLVGQYTK